MWRYILTRFFLFLPTLVIISLLAFFISLIAPGDPVERNVEAQTGAGNKSLSEQRLIQKKIWRKKLGLDLPVFYFSMHSLAEPDTLYRVYPPLEKETLSRFVSQYGNWPEISKYYSGLKEIENTASLIEKNIPVKDDPSGLQHQKLNEVKFEARSLCGIFNPLVISYTLNKLLDTVQGENNLLQVAMQIREAQLSYMKIIAEPTTYKNYIPVIRFHPLNQYQRWIFGDGNWLTGAGALFSKGIVRGDFGTSYQTGLPILDELKPRMAWSLLLAFIGILISYVLSVPIGIYAAGNVNKSFDKISGTVLFFIYSLPLFWVATLLLLLFANPGVLQIFPASGILPLTGYPAGATWWQKLTLSLPFMVLPLFCYTYSVIAYLSRSIRISMLSELRLDYIKTARAKGLSENQVLLKHAYRNTQLPLITLIANIFPMSIAGSLIIESIFSIPGMGLETIYAIQHQNYPVIVAIFTLTGILTLIGYFLAHLLYAFADPRISYQKAFS